MSSVNKVVHHVQTQDLTLVMLQSVVVHWDSFTSLTHQRMSITHVHNVHLDVQVVQRQTSVTAHLVMKDFTLLLTVKPIL